MLEFKLDSYSCCYYYDYLLLILILIINTNNTTINTINIIIISSSSCLFTQSISTLHSITQADIFLTNEPVRKLQKGALRLKPCSFYCCDKQAALR